jgi:hypothetical protein
VRGLNKFRLDLSLAQPSSTGRVVCSFRLRFRHFRRPDLPVDPENLKVREPAEDGSLDNRFSGPSATTGNAATKKKCGLQTFSNRIVGGEICEIDEFPWAALLLYESSERKGVRHVDGISI